MGLHFNTRYNTRFIGKRVELASLRLCLSRRLSNLQTELLFSTHCSLSFRFCRVWYESYLDFEILFGEKKKQISKNICQIVSKVIW